MYLKDTSGVVRVATSSFFEIDDVDGVDGVVAVVVDDDDDDVDVDVVVDEVIADGGTVDPPVAVVDDDDDDADDGLLIGRCFLFQTLNTAPTKHTTANIHDCHCGLPSIT